MKRNNDIEKLLGLALLFNLFPIVGLRGATGTTAPRLVVQITIDQLRSDYMEYFSPFYKPGGFKRLLQEGLVYEAASYPFSPLDRASAVTCIATGTTPQFNNIPSEYWFDRSTLHPFYCIADSKYGASPENIATSTISDQLKIATSGRSLIYSVASDKDAAVLSVGHAADGAFWLDSQTSRWTTSAYYSPVAQQWTKNYNSISSSSSEPFNDRVAKAALQCITLNVMGRDEVTDYLSVTLSARLGDTMGTRTEMEGVYVSLDQTLDYLISGIERKVGQDNVLFVLTATGNADSPEINYAKYHIPTGTFYINRTAQLLNMYLSAIYGAGRWVDGYYRNQIFLSHKLIEDKHLAYSEVVGRSREMLLWTSGVATVSNNPELTERSGDLLIGVKPGWKIVNEDTQETYRSNNAYVPFPIIFLGKGITPRVVTTPVTTDRIAPTIAKCIQIRAPNACSAPALP